MDFALIFKHIKRDFLCSQAGWNAATIIASFLNDVGRGYDVAPAPTTINPSELDLAPTSFPFPAVPSPANLSIRALVVNIDCPLPIDAFVSASVHVVQ
jgi:hypothetical protein